MKLVVLTGGGWRLDLGMKPQLLSLNNGAPFVWFYKDGSLKGATRWQEIVDETIEWMRRPDINVL